MAISIENLAGRFRNKRAVLVHPYHKFRGESTPGRFPQEEFHKLATSSGLTVVDYYTPGLSKINPKTYIGSGQTEKVGRKAEEHDADLVVFRAPLSPSHQRELEQATGKTVTSRRDIIFQVFLDSAETHEGKLQVELARLRYDLPRIDNLVEEQSRTGAGIGTVGPGETTVEVLRQKIDKRISLLEDKIEKIRSDREERRKRRVNSPLPIVSIIGYTNVGKSSLFNRMTSSDVEVHSRFFATLDPTVRQLGLPDGGKMLITDTVGFIQDLPEELMDAFRSTLEELAQTDLLILMDDASVGGVDSRLDAVKNTLEENGLGDIPRWTVLNKIDRAGELRLAELENQYPDSILMSVEESVGIEELFNRLIEFKNSYLADRQPAG